MDGKFNDSVNTAFFKEISSKELARTILDGTAPATPSEVCNFFDFSQNSTETQCKIVLALMRYAAEEFIPVIPTWPHTLSEADKLLESAELVVRAAKPTGLMRARPRILWLLDRDDGLLEPQNRKASFDTVYTVAKNTLRRLIEKAVETPVIFAIFDGFAAAIEEYGAAHFLEERDDGE